MKYNLDDLLTVGQVARILNKSTDTIRRWHLTKKLVPAIIDQRNGKSTRMYSKKQLDEFRKSHSDEIGNIRHFKKIK